MISEQIQIKRFSYLWIALVLLFIASAFIIAYIVNENVNYLMGVIAFIVLAMTTVYVERIRSTSILLEEESLVFLPQNHSFPYCDIKNIRRGESSSKNRFAIALYDSSRVLEIPAQLSHSSQELFDFLETKINKNVNREPHPKLAAYVDKELNMFSAERVFVFTALNFDGHKMNIAGKISYAIAFFLIGLIFIFSSFLIDLKNREQWVAVGFLTILVGFFALAIALSRRQKFFMNTGNPEHTRSLLLVAAFGLFGAMLIRNSQAKKRVMSNNACLVISPRGIALKLGQLDGKMKWDEINHIEYPLRNPKKLPQVGALSGLGIYSGGVVIVVPDVFDTSLGDIQKLLEAYWRPPQIEVELEDPD